MTKRNWCEQLFHSQHLTQCGKYLWANTGEQILVNVDSLAILGDLFGPSPSPWPCAVTLYGVMAVGRAPNL